MLILEKKFFFMIQEFNFLRTQVLMMLWSLRSMLSTPSLVSPITQAAECFGQLIRRENH